MMAHIKKYKSHYLLAGILSLFWVGILFASPSIMQVRGVSFWQCGNGVLEGTEVCDDGDTTNFGICNATCTALTLCGDGTTQNPDGVGAAEACDDGNALNGDGCSSTCQIELPVCGNGRVEAGEGCDDGNTVNGDGCSAMCAIEIPAPVCGNAKIEIGETCDDGNILDGDGCSAMCQIEPPLPVCGNGTVEAGEACDGGSLNGTPNHCNLTCSGTTAPVCGNSAVESGETCDDGNKTNGDGCSSLCQIEPPAACGNGKVETGEICDEGVLNGTPNHCNIACSGPTPSTCGNKIVETGEVCDDGTTTGLDTCNFNCTALTRCGDGIVQSPDGMGSIELCDDGNMVSGDGCSATCTIEIPACVEPSIKITFNRIEVVNATSWKNQVASGDKTFTLTGNFVVIPLSQIQKFDSNLRNAFQIGWEGEAKDKHLRIGSMKQVALNSKSKLNYGIELDYTVEFLGDVNITAFNRMNLEVGKETIVFNDGKIVYSGDRTDGAHFLTGNGPSDDWSKYFLTFKDCGAKPVDECHDERGPKYHWLQCEQERDHEHQTGKR
jgi:cysteine-rich repeat protein